MGGSMKAPNVIFQKKGDAERLLKRESFIYMY